MHVLTDAVVALELAHGEVVYMHVLSDRHIRLGEADDLVVAPDGIASLQCTRGQFVAWWNQVVHRHVLVVDGRSRDQLLGGNQHIVGRVQTDGQGLIHYGFLTKDSGTQFAHRGLDANGLDAV